MSKISNAIMLTLLEEITDYNGVTLTQEETNTLETICDAWEDKDSIESEINIYLTKIGFTYDDELCQWSRGKLTLPISSGTFTDWYYSDHSSSTLRDIAYNLIDAVSKTGEFKVTVDDLFDNCGYIPISLLDITCELGDQLREAFEDDEIEQFKGIVLGKQYEIVLIK